MKRIIILICVSFSSFGQFTLLPSGLVIEGDPVGDFIVIDFKDIKQERLFNLTKEFINKNYKSPKDVLNDVQGESISLKGYQPGIIGVKPTKGKMSKGLYGDFSVDYGLEYSIDFKFKDDRIRIDKPGFSTYRFFDTGGKGVLTLSEKPTFGCNCHRIFDEKGNVIEVAAKNQIPGFFNGLIEKLEAYIKSEQKEDW